jgi:hypothetical protein
MQNIPKGNKTWNPTHEYWTVYKPYTQRALDALKKYYTYYTIVDKRGQPDPTFDVTKFNMDMKAKAKKEEEDKRKQAAQARSRQQAQARWQAQTNQGYSRSASSFRHNPSGSGGQWGSRGQSADAWRQANKAQSKYKDHNGQQRAEEQARKEELAKKRINRTVERRSGVNFGQACEILGVEKTATYEVMKKAYWGLSKKHHTDRGGDKDTMLQLNNAWDVIKAYKIGA